MREGVENCRIAGSDEGLDLWASRPVLGRMTAGIVHVRRIDAAREKPFESRVDRQPAERLAHELLEAERR